MSLNPNLHEVGATPKVTSTHTSSSTPIVHTLVKTITNLIKFLGVDLVSFYDIQDNEMILGYDLYYGLIYKTKTGIFKIQAEQII